LLQRSFLNLAGQQAYKPPLIPENPHPSIDITIPNHVSVPLARTEHDGWKNIVHPPLDNHTAVQILITLNNLLFMPSVLLLPCIDIQYPKPHIPIMPRPRSLNLRII